MTSSSSFRIQVAVQGMTCQHCVDTVTKALKSIDDVDSDTVFVDLDAARATMHGSTSRPLDVLGTLVATTIEDLGYDAGTPVVTASSDDAQQVKDQLPSSSSDQKGANDKDIDAKKVPLTMSIFGMTCSHCTEAVRTALARLPFVIPESISVSLDDSSASLLFLNPDPAMITKDVLMETIEDLGYDVDSIQLGQHQEPVVRKATGLRTAAVSIDGMTCSHCTGNVAGAIKSLPGVVASSVLVDLDKRLATFDFEGDDIKAQDIIDVVQDLGYDVVGTPRIKGTTESIPTEKSLSSTASQGGLSKVVMRVVGMTCQSCVAALTDALQTQVPGVQRESVKVDLGTEMAQLVCSQPDTNAIRRAVEERGYDVENIQVLHNLVPPIVMVSEETKQTAVERVRSATAESIVSLGAVSVETPVVAMPKKVNLQISGMTCASCVQTIEQGLQTLPSVVADSVKVNLLTGGASFAVQGNVLAERDIVRAVSNLGYEASNVSIVAEQESLQDTSSLHKAELIITGMYCNNCVDKVKNAILQLPGTIEKTVKVDLETGLATFEYQGDAITRKRIRNCILQLGFMADSIQITKIGKQEKKESVTATTRLTVTGMTCSSCVANIERAMMKQRGVVSCQVNLLAKSAVIQHEPTIVGSRALANMIEQLGYKAELSQDVTMDNLANQRQSMRATLDREIKQLRRRFLWSLVFAVPIVLIELIFMMALPAHNPVHVAFQTPITAGLSVGDLISFFLATPVQFWLGWPFYLKSYRSLRYAHTANMETLVAMGTTVAYAASVGSIIAAMVKKEMGETMNYFETSVLLITFIHCGKWLEALAKGKTAETITKLMDLQPDRAILVQVSFADDRRSSATAVESPDSKKEQDVTEYEYAQETLTEQEIDAKDIQVGDILKVNAGGRIPCDGKIWRGSTSTDESMITGESVPVLKKEGDDVVSATINMSSTIYIRAIRVGADTTLSRIIQLVQDAQASPKAPIEQVADKISSIFVPIVIFLAVITFIIWEVVGVYGMVPDEWLPMGEDRTTFALLLAVSVLVIACPCGLGLASPTAVMVGTGIAARYGVLVKGGGYALEMASKVDTIAFDKTGTLTLGKPTVTDSWIAATDLDNDQKSALNTWKILGRVTSSSNHPLSKSIEKKAKEFIAMLGGNQEGQEDLFPGVSLTNSKEIPGRGVVATLAFSKEFAEQFWFQYDRHHRAQDPQRAVNVFLGNKEWMDENRARYATSRQARVCEEQLVQWQDQGKSVVMIAVAPVDNGGGTEESGKLHTEEGCGDACGCAVCRCTAGSLCCSSSKTFIVAQVAIADIPRPEAEDVVAELRKKGIEVWMITGDNPRTGRVIAEQLGIDRECVLAGVKPEQKADKIRSLQRRGGPARKKRFALGKKDRSAAQSVVAMVGDGINDSPSLAQADVGISVGSATDVAMEAASIVLIRNNMWDLLTMYDVSKTVVRRIRINFLWAFIYNVVAIPIAAGILYPGTGHGLPPYIAGIAMVASSVSVVCSSLLLRFYRAPKHK